MNNITPSIDGTARAPGDLTCGRDTAEDSCVAPAAWHVLWTLDLDNSLVCEEHMAEAQDLWVYLARHRISPGCTMPNSAWFADRCMVQPNYLAAGDVPATTPDAPKGGED